MKNARKNSRENLRSMEDIAIMKQMDYEGMTVTIPASMFSALVEDQIKLRMVALELKSGYGVYPDKFESITGIKVRNEEEDHKDE